MTTIAALAASTSARTSASRIDPPGCTMAVTPASSRAAGTDEWRHVLGAWQWLRTRGYPAASIGLLGLSMGAAAVSLAVEHEPTVAAAWLDSPLADLLSTAVAVTPPPDRLLVPGVLLMSGPLGGGDLLGATAERALEQGLHGRPLMIVHGDIDETVPVDQAHRMAAAAARGGTTVEPWIVVGAKHIESTFHQTSQYAARVGAFFRASLAPRP